MAEDKTKDFGDYAESYEKVDPARRVVARKYIVELCFMEEQLDRLKEDIEKNGAVDNFVQGKQSMLRESPAMKAYCTLVQRYGDLQKSWRTFCRRRRTHRKRRPAISWQHLWQRGKNNPWP